MNMNNDGRKLTTSASGKGSKVTIQTTVWSKFQDVDKVQEFSDSDTECLRELRDVLKKHNQLERFGISLLHKHFEVANDEILLETTNIKERTQFIRPVKAKEIERQGHLLMSTCMKLVDGKDGKIAMHCLACARNKDGHTGQHGTYSKT